MLRKILNRGPLSIVLLVLAACSRNELIEHNLDVIYQVEVVNSQTYAINIAIDKGEGLVTLGQVGGQSSRRFQVRSRTDDIEVIAAPAAGGVDYRRKVDLDRDKINRVIL